MTGDLSDGDFAAAFDTFADECDDFITQAKTGEPYDIDNEPQKPMSWIWIPISLVAGIVLSLIVVGTMKSKLKTVRFQAAANNYVKAGSMNLTVVAAEAVRIQHLPEALPEAVAENSRRDVRIQNTGAI